MKIITWFKKLAYKMVKLLKNVIRRLLLLGFLTTILLLGAPIAVFVGENMRLSFLEILDQILNSVIGPGLFCGFMTTSTVGIRRYFLVVPSFFIKDNRRRVAAMTAFVTGQFVMFTSVYNRPLHQELVQPHRIILLFLGFFLVQLLWTSLRTLRNWRFLDPNDKRRRVVRKRRRVVRRLVRLQFEFMMTFILQFKFPYIEPDSMIRRLVDSYLKDKAKNVLFVRSSFVGWFIGHIFFIILFRKLLEFIVLITIWVRKNFFES